MSTDDSDTFDLHAFGGIRRIYNADNEWVRTSRGTSPRYMQFKDGFVVTYNEALDRIQVSGGAESGFVTDSYEVNTASPLWVTAPGNQTAALGTSLTLGVGYDGTSIVLDGENLAVGEITDAQHGELGAGTAANPLHPLAVPGTPGTPGFLSGPFARDLTDATDLPMATRLVKRGSSGEVKGVWYEDALAGPKALTGSFRMSNNSVLGIWRNAGNSADIHGPYVDNTNALMVGNNTADSVKVGGIPGTSNCATQVYVSAITDVYVFLDEDQVIRIQKSGTSCVLTLNGVRAKIVTDTTLDISAGAGDPVVTVSSNALGFYNATPAAKPTITGAKDGNAALASLISGLASLGLIVDSTT